MSTGNRSIQTGFSPLSSSSSTVSCWSYRKPMDLCFHGIAGGVISGVGSNPEFCHGLAVGLRQVSSLH